MNSKQFGQAQNPPPPPPSRQCPDLSSFVMRVLPNRRGGWCHSTHSQQVQPSDCNVNKITSQRKTHAPPPTAFSVSIVSGRWNQVLVSGRWQIWRCGRGRGGETCHLKTHAATLAGVGKNTWWMGGGKGTSLSLGFWYNLYRYITLEKKEPKNWQH